MLHESCSRASQQRSHTGSLADEHITGPFPSVDNERHRRPPRGILPQVLLRTCQPQTKNLPDREPLRPEEGPILVLLVRTTDICSGSILAPRATTLLLLPVSALRVWSPLRVLPHLGAQYPPYTYNLFTTLLCLASHLAAASRDSPTSATAHAPRFKALRCGW